MFRGVSMVCFRDVVRGVVGGVAMVYLSGLVRGLVRVYLRDLVRVYLGVIRDG